VNREHAAIAHRLELCAQGDRLRPGLPGVRHPCLRGSTCQPRNTVVDEVDARGEDQPVVGQALPTGDADGARRRVDGDRLAADAANTQLLEAAVADGDVGQLPAAADHQVGQRAGNERGIALDQRHLYRAAAPQAQIAGRRRPAIAAADDDDLGRTRRCGLSAGAQRPCEHRRRARAEQAAAGKAASGGHRFCAARYDAAASICASV
jgi:hypothetical protein